MHALTDFLQSMGAALLEPFWFPAVIWTIAAIPVILLLQKTDKIPPVYHCHSRVALMLALPLGILGSYSVELLSGFVSSPEAPITKFIIIPNPMTVSAAQTTPTVWDSLSNPMLWIGLCSTL